jgi:hypothetical protein
MQPALRVSRRLRPLPGKRLPFDLPATPGAVSRRNPPRAGSRRSGAAAALVVERRTRGHLEHDAARLPAPCVTRSPIRRPAKCALPKTAPPTVRASRPGLGGRRSVVDCPADETVDRHRGVGADTAAPVRRMSPPRARMTRPRTPASAAARSNRPRASPGHLRGRQRSAASSSLVRTSAAVCRSADPEGGERPQRTIPGRDRQTPRGRDREKEDVIAALPRRTSVLFHLINAVIASPGSRPRTRSCRRDRAAPPGRCPQ